MKKLIVTCDDCGLSEGINLATVDLYEQGFVTAATVMTNFPAAQHALELFARYPLLDVGVHLNLTDGFPLTGIGASSELTHRNGNFKPKSILFMNALISRQTFLDLVEVELTEQIEFFLARGLQPQHLTTHIHFHCFPPLRKIIYSLARKFDIRWVRNSDLRRAIVPFNKFLPVQGATTFDTVPSPNYLIALQYWMKYSSPKKLLEKILSLQGAIELVVHPCLEEDDTYPQGVPYQPHDRFYEMQFFLEFAQLMRTEAPDAFQLSAGL
jgi:predicted glycoside hydrolase/deacetylase ChbG (UPF0249 family)